MEDAAARALANRPDPPAKSFTSRLTGGSGDPPTGVHQKQKMVKPGPLPGIPSNNQQIAEAAAKKYNKDKKRIQKAIAQVDKTTPRATEEVAEAKSCCVIL